MRILISTDDPGQGGVAEYVSQISVGLQKMGHTVLISQSKPDDYQVLEQKRPGIEHHWLDYQTRIDRERLLSDKASSIAILEAAKPELILFANCSPVSQIAATYAAAEKAIPFVIIEGFAAPYPSLSPSVLWFQHHQKLLYKIAASVIGVSGETLSILRKYYGLHPQKGELVYYGRPEIYYEEPDPTTRKEIRKSLSIPEDAVVCLTAARMEIVKGFDYLLEAVLQLKESPVWEKVWFLWAGDGSLLESATEKISKARLTDKLRLLGRRNDMLSLLNSADIFLLPSQFEGMPLAITEAMAKRLPIVASAVSGIPEQLGEAGLLLPDPVAEPDAIAPAIVAAIETLTSDPEKRKTMGIACHERARDSFQESEMLRKTEAILARALLPAHDYASPGLEFIRPDAAFPNLTPATPQSLQWKYLRDEIPHANYVDKRVPGTGFLNRDEAVLLYNLALPFKGKNGLEIGCWFGWSAAHIALAGVSLDVIDPVLANPQIRESVEQSLKACKVMHLIKLHSSSSPMGVDALAQNKMRWDFIFIDGNHEAPYPTFDAAVVAEYAKDDALVVFHDLASPDVAQGLDYLRLRGWQTCIYQTSQIMGVAWRGQARPAAHLPDPRVQWHLPKHLRHFRIGPPA